jgi:hypothetical protein
MGGWQNATKALRKIQESKKNFNKTDLLTGCISLGIDVQLIKSL